MHVYGVKCCLLHLGAPEKKHHFSYLRTAEKPAKIQPNTINIDVVRATQRPRGLTTRICLIVLLKGGADMAA
jgi:hypothetical protein